MISKSLFAGMDEREGGEKLWGTGLSKRHSTKLIERMTILKGGDEHLLFGQ
jgi:hypothetical protein